MIKNIIYIFLILLLLLSYSSVSSTVNKDSMFILIFLVFGNILFFALAKEKIFSLKRQYMKHSTFVLLGFIIVHFQYYIDYLLGNVTIGNSYIWINIDVIVKSMLVSTLGLTAFLYGYSLLSDNLKKNNQFVSETFKEVKLLLIIATISLVVFFINVNPLYLAGFYGSEDMGPIATYAILIFTLNVFAIILQNCRNMVLTKKIPKNFKEYIQKQGYLLLFLIGLYLLSVMISGDRGPIIIFGISYFSGYFFVTKKKLNLKYTVLFLFAGAVIITSLGEIRRLDKNLDFSSKLQESIKNEKVHYETSFLPQTQELAGSVRTVHATIDYIPQKHDFLYGRFQFQQIVSSIPFFSPFLYLIFENHHQKYLGSSAFVTWINQGDFPTSGDGTSCIADLFFDFGIIGVLVGMLLFGYFIRFLEISMYSNSLPSLIVHIFGLVYLSNAIYISRSTILFDLRTVVWIFIILYINKYFFQKK